MQKALDEYIGRVMTIFSEALCKGDILENIVDAVCWPVTRDQVQTAPFGIGRGSTRFSHAPLYTGYIDNGGFSNMG